MYIGGRFVIYYKNKYIEEKNFVNILYSNFFYCLSFKSLLKLFYYLFYILVLRECWDILFYVR